MFTNTNSIVINNTNMGPYLTKAKYGYHKLWANDSGRSLSGKQSGTLLGIFPKLVLTFRKLTQAEIELLTPIFDSSRQTVTYYDPKKKANYTMTTYTGDWEIEYENIQKGSSFSLSFISVSKRV